MEFTSELKNKFIDLLVSHNIIVVSHQYGKDYTKYEHKIIGMHDGLRWDFTPMIADITECRTNNKGVVHLAVRGFATELIRDTLFKFRNDNFRVPGRLIDNTGDFIGQYYL